MLCVHDEKDNGCGEEVGHLSLVWLLLEDFRSHVAWRSDDRLVESASISAFKRACEAKVDYLQIVIVVIKKDVFWLQIAVRETVLVDVVESKQHLLKVVSANFLVERSAVGHIVEQLTALDGFLSDVGDWDGFTILLRHSGLLAELVILDDVLVFEFLSCLDFFLQ